MVTAKQYKQYKATRNSALRKVGYYKTRSEKVLLDTNLPMYTSCWKLRLREESGKEICVAFLFHKH